MLLLACDLGSKAWVERHLSRARPTPAGAVCAETEQGDVIYQRLPGRLVTILTGIVELEYAENCFAAFGTVGALPSGLRRVLLAGAGLAASLLLLVAFARGAGGPRFAVAVPLIVSGALGNFLDRALRGYVVDFVHVHYESPVLWLTRFDYPHFNVADITIAIGAALMVAARRGPRRATCARMEARHEASAP